MTWNNLKLGNGGAILHLDIANDGTMVCGTDTFGGYVWDTSLDKWRQLLTSTGMPGSVVTALLNGTSINTGQFTDGFDDIIIDHSNSNNIWVVYRGDVFKSTNKGVSFSATGFPTQDQQLNISNSLVKGLKPYSGVDPNNSNIAYFSTGLQGIFRTTDGGTTFAQVTAVSAGLPVYGGNNPSAPVNSGTDTTSITYSSGTVGTTVSFTNNSNPFGLPQGTQFYVKAYRTSDPSKQILGQVNGSSGTTFSLLVTSVQGSGTFNDWTISLFCNAGNYGSAGRVGAGHRIVFDTSGGTVTAFSQTVTKNIYIHTYGVNTYFSSDGGVTWTQVTQTNMPAVISQMACDVSGNLWAIDGVLIYNAGGSIEATNLNKYTGGTTGTWTNNVASIGGSGGGAAWFNSLAIDPVSTSHICLGGPQTNPLSTALSTDGGVNFTRSSGTPTFANSSPNDVTWLTDFYTASPSFFFGSAPAVFDPVTSGKLWIGSEGVWYLTPPTTVTGLALTQQSRGIEEFIAIRITAPGGTSNTVFMGAWDFPLFYSNNFSTYPALTSKPGTAATSLNRGYDLDWLWNSPTTLVDVVGGSGFHDPTQNFSGLTTTGGAAPSAWTTFSGIASIAAGDPGGNIAISSPSVYVYVPVASASKPMISTDSGATWNAVAALPSASWGPIFSSATAAKTIDSDKANGDIYLYNINLNDGFGDGIYRMTAGTNSWALQSRPSFDASSNFNEQLKCPGIAGVVFFTPGHQGGGSFPTNTRFYWSINQGVNWNPIANFKQVVTFGFGAISPGQSFPNIFAAGWHDSGSGYVYGIYRCQNFNSSTGAGTWTQIGEQFPLGIMDFPRDIDGDKVTPGKVYVFTNGGAFFFDPSTSSTIGFPVVHDHGKRHVKMIGY